MNSAWLDQPVAIVQNSRLQQLSLNIFKFSKAITPLSIASHLWFVRFVPNKSLITIELQRLKYLLRDHNSAQILLVSCPQINARLAYHMSSDNVDSRDRKSVV